MGYSIIEINHMTQPAFVQVFGSVFENTPSIAAQTWHHRPFLDLASLHQAMVTLVEQMPEDEQLTLIRAHPDLGSRVQMAPVSVQEQTSVGLDRLSPAEYGQFQQLNATYQTKFGFPFIMAVKGQTKAAILIAFAKRLNHTTVREKQQAILEIEKIARLRLEDLLH
ncbi:OHCU decarboxylase [Leptolyngbya sp. PCC 7375]|nr:OHCU decarboxylase [Leptolyngbya sp. PCC 7375]